MIYNLFVIDTQQLAVTQHIMSSPIHTLLIPFACVDDVNLKTTIMRQRRFAEAELRWPLAAEQ